MLTLPKRKKATGDRTETSEEKEGRWGKGWKDEKPAPWRLQVLREFKLRDEGRKTLRWPQ